MRITDGAIAAMAGVRLTAALAALCGSAAAGDLRPEAACAAYDLHLLTLLEDHGQAAEVPNDALAVAAATLNEARGACREGDIDRASRLYGRIELDPPQGRPTDRVAFR